MQALSMLCTRGDEFLRQLLTSLYGKPGWPYTLAEAKTIDAKHSIKESLVSAWGNFSMGAGVRQAA